MAASQADLILRAAELAAGWTAAVTGRPPPRTVPRILEEAGWHASHGDAAQAEALCHEASRLAPNDPRPLALLAQLHVNRGGYEHAGRLMTRACALMPDHPDLHSARAAVAAYTDPAAAEQAARRALALNPRHAEATRILGLAAVTQQDVDGALVAFRRAVDLEPGHAFGRIYLAAVLIYLGQCAAGFTEFARSMEAEVPTRWTPGEPIAGRDVLLIDTHGRGDALMFCRWVPALAKAGARVTIATAQAPLVRLLGRLPGVARVIDRPEDLAEARTRPDVLQASLWATAHILGVDGPDQHVTHPYLTADPADVERWRARLPHDGRLKIGLIWGCAGPWPPYRLHRALSLSELAPLGRVPGVRFYSLQQGPPACDLDAPPFDLVNLAPDCHDMAETAAAMCALDLVVTVDTGPGNLAGAVGVPTLILLRAGVMGDWRWGHGDTSPWYPSARRFQQQQVGDWSAPIARVADELAHLVAERDAGR